MVTLVAKLEGRVLATFSMVPDNTLLGLPLESIYGEEIKGLRRSRRRVAEVTSFAADKDLRLREFRQVFVALIRLCMQYHLSQGGDTWVITVNPRHRDFYTKAMGFVPLGPPRTYSSVQNHPAEGYWFDVETCCARSAPKMYGEIFGECAPRRGADRPQDALARDPLPRRPVDQGRPRDDPRGLRLRRVLRQPPTLVRSGWRCCRNQVRRRRPRPHVRSPAGTDTPHRGGRLAVLKMVRP